MNEKLQYATMLEIPVNTCNVTFNPIKKRKYLRKKHRSEEDVKEQLVKKVNEQTETENTVEEQALRCYDCVEKSEGTIGAENKDNRQKRFSILSLQLCIIGALIAGIFLTNVLYADSAMNVFFKNVFTAEQKEVVDTRGYEEFAPVIACGENLGVALDNGVMIFSGKGSVYAPCDGTVSSISLDGNGKYVIEITHSENFKSVLTGIDYAYASADQKVFANIPVGYVTADGATMCFTGVDGAVISDYQLVENSVVWAV